MGTISFLKEFQNEINWDKLIISNNIIIDELILEEFRHQFNWSLVSQSTKIKWTEELIEKYCLLWNFRSLSENISLPWTLSLLKKYAPYWDTQKLKQNQIVKDLMENSKVSYLGIEFGFLALGIFENSQSIDNVKTKINYKQSYNNNWIEHGNDYCSACMMTPCHCSDPDPG